ncbi:hypothetical protein JMA_18390 [Jeotgalibacillus malaysiensis]|uniref:Uncharacterized protein n=1 Tax=Jeotgalibacillus malaysiensis TaxID=1508404 RepID=A0A0B5ALX5_9BACL|nr:hypothetical protein [Jeotgalibacillus malaysiensis]AJD91156.1 hypothetical protein JMA_18390 [Jeotgalibacillus malaysiensis]
MLTGIILCLLCSVIFIYQMRKDHINRNVVILFFALAGMIAGAWFIFDAVIIRLI